MYNQIMTNGAGTLIFLAGIFYYVFWIAVFVFAIIGVITTIKYARIRKYEKYAAYENNNQEEKDPYEELLDIEKDLQKHQKQEQ